MASARAFWRWLTSMRTALILLFLLAVAAVPGSMLPQRNISIERVNSYLSAHPSAGPWLDRLWLFDVYSSPWFSAVYLLLFVSLIGCLVPRMRGHIAALRAAPPEAPGRLDRLPRHAEGLRRSGAPAEVAEGIGTALRSRRWRAVVRRHDDGTATVAAEKGYLKETGNLLFHFSLMGLLIGVALGSWYGWHANRILVAGKDHAFCNTLQQYDSYGLGARVSGSDLYPFCMTLNSFSAKYLDDGQPVQYSADISYTDGINGPERSKTLEVNHPLRLPRANVYLIGHGYAPVVRYTDKYGHAQTTVATFLPDDSFLTSHGVAAFPDANTAPDGKRDPNAQVAFNGIYLPTMPAGPWVGHSAYPAERDPGLMLVAYRGNLGLDVGTPQSVYSLDQAQIDSGELKKIGQHMLRPGQSWTLPDGSKVEFLGTQQWITLSIRYDPGERVVLIAAALLLTGLLTSLTGRRRRVWARVVPDGDGRSLVAMGGLSRTDHPGLADEFDQLVALVDGDEQTELTPAGKET